jgi:tRNA pseudouridine38-40 synthase
MNIAINSPRICLWMDMRIALGLEYNGAAFCGWQTQPDGCAVQDAVERALEKFIGLKVGTHCAGRTDAGVHALRQVVHFDSEIVRDTFSWVRGTNAFLPPAVRVLWAREVSDDFHARFSAESRGYRYLLLNAAVDSAVFNNQLGFFHVPLDERAMQCAADLLLGEHDFSSFRAAECQAKTPVKTMVEAKVQRRGEEIIFTFRANAFLHHMVRNIVGSLVYVGAKRLSVDEFAAIFAARDRTRAAPTFAACGLYLADVVYPARFNIPPATQRYTYPG